MGLLERTVRMLFKTPARDPFVDKSPKLLATPSQITISKFQLPSGESSASSSSSSLSSSSTFWMSPAPSRWSYTPSSIRNAASKRQIAVVLCLLLALLIWIIPQPSTWRRQVIHITVQQPISNPYQVLRPLGQTPVTKKHVPDPTRWLEHNSNNKHAENTGLGLLKSVPSLGHASGKPHAALISLVRNSELPGLMQSMRQLEYQWNRKYNYPWIFFNDEPFSNEFKVRSEQIHRPFQRSVLSHTLSGSIPTYPRVNLANVRVGSHTESYVGQMLLRSRSKGALVPA